jgi:zinc protease
MGTAASVRGLESRDLAAFHRRVMRAGNLVLVVAGDVNADEIITLANRFLGKLPSGTAAAPKLSADPRPTSPREITVIKRGKQQAHIVIGFQGTMYRSPDRHAMAVLNNILAGQGGRLFRTLRDRMSLAYTVSSVNQEGIEPGHLAVYIGTEPGKIDTAIAAIRKELFAIREKLVDKEELARSKQYLAGVYELDLQRNGARAGIHAFNHLYRLGPESVAEYPQEIMKVTAEDVLRVARRSIQPDEAITAIVKPA